MRNIKQNSGLTLIELMVTLTVLATMVAIGVPQYQRMIETNRIAGSINSLAGDLKLARSEAAKRNQVVTVCASNNGNTCNTANWDQGWIVFADQNGDRVVNVTDTMVAVNTGATPGFAFTDTGFTNPGVLQYAPSGALTTTSLAAAGGTFKLCETGINDAIRARGITINTQGRIRSARDTDASNIREDFNGVDFVCP